MAKYKNLPRKVWFGIAYVELISADLLTIEYDEAMRRLRGKDIHNELGPNMMIWVEASKILSAIEVLRPYRIPNPVTSKTI